MGLAGGAGWSEVFLSLDCTLGITGGHDQWLAGTKKKKQD